jgi:hypothetical protein
MDQSNLLTSSAVLTSPPTAEKENKSNVFHILSNHEDENELMDVLVLLRIASLILACMTNLDISSSGGGEGGSSSSSRSSAIRSEIIILIHTLQLEEELKKDIDIANALKLATSLFYTATNRSPPTPLPKDSTITAAAAATTTTTTATTTTTTTAGVKALTFLSTPTPFLLSLKDLYGERYDQLMTPIQTWFYKTTQKKKRLIGMLYNTPPLFSITFQCNITNFIIDIYISSFLYSRKKYERND